jgi:hypothetical protein
MKQNLASALASIAITLVTGGAALAVAQLPTMAENEAIAYSTATPDDPIARLQQQIDRGEATLAFDPKHGYLPALLHALAIPVSSQGLVFSRTSLQVDRISPWSPRAIYFNDDAYVGWVQGGPIMEAAVIDPKIGPVFYTIDQRASDHPKFERQTRTCLICHDSSSSTGGVPGFIVRSVFTDRYGYAFASIGKDVTTDRTPVAERWGGWYVTGTVGDSVHMGNIFAPVLAHEIDDKAAYTATSKGRAERGVTDLHGRFDVSRYLTPGSDVVALLVIAHQSYVHNLITNAGYEARIEGDGAASSARVRSAAERLARAMLFANEAPLPGAVEGTSGFAAEFPASGPHDRRGRSLRDLDLKTRLFKYPLSYLVYSEGFDGLPEAVKTIVYDRIRAALTGSDTSPDFAHLSVEDRRNIFEILSDTKPGFAH